jgi:predicted cation transporter
MPDGLWLVAGLMVIMGAVLVLPFLSKKIEEELEAFLFIMGILSVSISRLWSWHLVSEAISEPVKITLAVLLAGLLFRLLRPKIKLLTTSAISRIGCPAFVFLLVVLLGILSSAITAIIAALVLVEIISALNLPRNAEIKIVVITCFAIGLGAVLTPLGEPLATIAISKLKGPPHNAGFFFLFKLLFMWVIPIVLALSALAIFWGKKSETSNSLRQDKPETYKNVFLRTFKVYIFVLALVLLGTGFTPLVERYLVNMPVKAIYWINISSAVLDNATLTAAEISPNMSADKIECLLLGLLIAGGMLIPGNIPNIICANKLGIKSKEWARLGVPLGLVIMVGVFILISFAL